MRIFEILYALAILVECAVQQEIIQSKNNFSEESVIKTGDNIQLVNRG